MGYTVDDFNSMSDEQEAARIEDAELKAISLIAAAPDLLDALREMCNAFSPDRCRMAAAQHGRASDADRAHAQARAAIAKAEGRS